MKVNLLPIALFAIVGTSFAIPPKNYKVKKVQAPKVAKKIKTPVRGQTSVANGPQLRNEGYTPGI